MADSPARVLRSLGTLVYLPMFLFALGEGALVPLIPSLAANLGADLATAGVVAGCLVLGRLAGSIPSGWLVARRGERTAMVLAALLALVGAALVLLAPTVVLLAAGVLLVGLGGAAFALARLAVLTTFVPLGVRGRAIALAGGTFRLGSFVGPFLAAAVLAVTTSVVAVVWVLVGCLVLVVVVLLVGRDRGPENVEQPGAPADEAGGAVPARRRSRAATPLTGRWDVLLRLGGAAASLSAIRSARLVLLPVWGVSIGLPGATIALVVGMAAGLDFALFYASGQVMDRYGRLWATLPAMLIMASGFVVLTFTHDLADATVWFVAIAALIAVGNGISSGALATLGADVAPPRDPAPFLGAWKTLVDAGGAAAPFVISAVTAVASVAAASAAVGLLGFGGAWLLWWYVPRYVPHRRGSPSAQGSGTT